MIAGGKVETRPEEVEGPWGMVGRAMGRGILRALILKGT
jgi:hypothetical protein